MESLYNVNGLMFWNEREIRLRRQFEEHFAFTMEQILLAENPAWKFIQVEGPQLTPRELVNPNYTNSDIWVQQAELSLQPKEEAINDIINGKITVPDHIIKETIETLGANNVPTDVIAGHNLHLMITQKIEESLVLRPETTPSSYVYAQHLLNSHSGVKPPFVVWQTGKSFRREQDQVTKNMRLKEFYQQEFQCIYAADTMNDYHAAVLEPVRKMLGEMIGLPTRIVESDRLPSYSEVTMDVEAWIPKEEDKIDGRWMEICSISRRTDFPQKARFQTKKKVVEKDLLVLEIAIGLCRSVYCFEQRRD